MKKLIIIFLMVILAGCASIQLNDTETVLGEIAARRLAYQIAMNSPQTIGPGIAICDGLINSPVGAVKTLTYQAVYMLTDQVGDDPMLRADLASVLSLIQFSEHNLPDISLIKQAAAAFKTGLDAARGKP